MLGNQERLTGSGISGKNPKKVTGVFTLSAFPSHLDA